MYLSNPTFRSHEVDSPDKKDSTSPTKPNSCSHCENSNHLQSQAKCFISPSSAIGEVFELILGCWETKRWVVCMVPLTSMQMVHPGSCKIDRAQNRQKRLGSEKTASLSNMSLANIRTPCILRQCVSRRTSGQVHVHISSL